MIALVFSPSSSRHRFVCWKTTILFGVKLTSIHLHRHLFFTFGQMLFSIDHKTPALLLVRHNSHVTIWAAPIFKFPVLTMASFPLCVWLLCPCWSSRSSQQLQIDPKFLLTFLHVCFFLFPIYQVSDCSQPEYAALRPGVWREHLPGFAASVSDHRGGGGLSWTWPQRLHSGLDVIACVAWVYSLTHTGSRDHLVFIYFFPPQFFIYGGYFALISLVFFFAGLCKVFSSRRSAQAAMENSTAGVETDSPPISGSESCAQMNATSVNVNGSLPAQQRWKNERAPGQSQIPQHQIITRWTF